MPFTFSHVAAALPIKDMKMKDGHRLFDFTALVFGSMAPDFEFFIRMQPIKQSMNIPMGHTISGIFCYDLPLCFLFAWVFHNIIKRPLYLHLPQPFAGQYAKMCHEKWRINSWRSFFIFCYSALLAMVIHVLWDSFTHVNSPVVQHIEFLRLAVNLFSHTIPVYKLLDHSGTLVGLAVVLWYLYSFGRDDLSEPVVFIPGYRKVFYFALIITIGFAVEFLWLYRYGNPSDMNEIAGPIIAFISGAGIGITLMSYFAMKVYRIEPRTSEKLTNSEQV